MDPTNLALGMLETKGTAALIAAADAAVKTADVRVAFYDKADAGIVTIYLLGEVAAVYAAIEAGKAEAGRVGRLLAARVIPRPDTAIWRMLEELLPAGIRTDGREGAS